jgi:hypothetical protein
LEIKDFEVKFNPNLVSNFNYQFHRNFDGSVYYADGKFYLLQKLTKANALFKIKSANNEESECGATVLDRPIDVCKLSMKTMSGPILSVIYQAMMTILIFP